MTDYPTGIILTNLDKNNIKSFRCKWFDIIMIPKNDDSNDNFELKISTNNEYNYEKAFRLLNSAIYLDDYGDVDIDMEQNYPSSKTSGYDNNISLYMHKNYKFMERIILLTQKASYRIKYQVVLHKYRIATKIHSNNIIDLGPYESYVKSNMYFLDDKVRYSQVITIFYSIIEDLDFDLKTNLVKRDKIKINGKYNTKIINDINNRLKKRNINIDEPVDWIKRFKPTKVENIYKSDDSKRALWAYREIRDCRISIVDAISYIKNIRNNITAHNLKEEFKSLTIYDVANANLLCRRLILESLKLWK